MIGVFRSPLFRRLYFAVALLAVLPLGATAIGTAIVGRAGARDATADSLRSDALILRTAARPLLERHDEPGLRELTRTAGTGAGVRVTIIADDGRVIADSEHDPATMENHAYRPEIRAARETGMGDATRFSDTLHETMVYVAVRADPDRPERGVVRVALGIAQLESRLRRIWVDAMIIATPLALLVLVSAALLLGAFAGAVQELTDVAQTVAAGGGVPPRRMEAEDRTDEVGVLARAVHDMADQLSERIRALARERDVLAKVVGGLTEGLIAVDRRGDVLLFNEAAQKMFGCSRPPALGGALVDALPHGPLVALVREALDAGAARDRVLEVFSGRVGEPRSVDARVAPFGSAPDEVAGVVVLLRDVTEAERYEQLRRDFVGNVSHELRTPLALVKGFLETLEDGALKDPERGPRFLEILRKHVTGLERLVADLLTLSALESGADERPAEPVHVQGAIDAVLEPFDEALGRRKIELERHTPADVPPVLGRPEHVERAIRNLVDNAAKFTPDGGRITVSARVEGDHVLVEVEDTGRGIPADALERVFERFYRVEKSRSREEGGTGLGLAIVKHIMAQAGGAVTVKSAPGKGSTFTLAFRRAPAL